MRHPAYLLMENCKKLYQEILNPNATSIKAKFTVLKSLLNHLVEEENRLHIAEKKKGSLLFFFLVIKLLKLFKFRRKGY